MSENSKNKSETTTPSEDAVASGNAEGEAAAVTGSSNTKEETKVAVGALEQAIQALEEQLETKDCSEISSMILTELLPKADVVQAKINEGFMKNSDTDSIKGKLSTIIQTVKRKCTKMNTRKNNTGKPPSMNTKKNSSKPPSAKPANNEGARQEKAKTNSKSGSKYEYGYLGFTKIDRVKPLYSDYLANKQGTETFGQFLQRSYVLKVPMKGGLSIWKKGKTNATPAVNSPTATNAAPKKSFFSRKNQPKEDIVGELMKQFKIFLSSKYVKSLALEKELTFAEYIDDRYTPKLGSIKMNTPAKSISTPAETTATPAESTSTSAPVETKSVKLEVPDVESYWTIDNLSKDKSIGFKAIVKIEKVTEKEISYVITDVIESGTLKEVKVGDKRDIFATSWTDLNKTPSGGPTQATSNLPKTPEEVIPEIDSFWELDRTADTMVSPEKQYKAKIKITSADQTSIAYKIVMMRKSGSAPLTLRDDSMPYSKWAQLLREKKVTPATAGGYQTRKQKRKITKRKTKSRRRV